MKMTGQGRHRNGIQAAWSPRGVMAAVPVRAALLLCLFASLLSSCMNEDLLGLEGGNPEDAVRIGAGVSATQTTRGAVGYIPETDAVSDGTFHLIYNTAGSSTTYGHARVEFGDPEGPTTGFAYYEEGGVEKELKWRNVYGNSGQSASSQSFYLTNLSPDRYTTSSTTALRQWRFHNVENPFVASPLDKVDGTNDILLGVTSASLSTGKVQFDMKHTLSLLKVTIEVYGASDDFFVELQDAEVSVTDVCKTLVSVYTAAPTSYSYQEDAAAAPSTNNGYGTYSDAGVLTLVKPGDETIRWANDTGSEPETDADGVRKKVYVTKEFIIPPQSIPPSPMPKITDEYTGARPKLTVKVPKSVVAGGTTDGYVTYSGYIPDVMFSVLADGTLSPQPENIAFKSGTQLNIRATINSPETDLVFAPVVVEPWTGVATSIVTTRQAGIYNERQWRAMVEAFTAGDLRELERYGYWDGEGNFVFQIWAGLIIPEEELKNCLANPGPGMPGSFCFLFNGYTVTLAEKGQETPSDPILSGAVGQIDLYNLVTGAHEEFLGIRNADHLRAAIAALMASGEPDVKSLSRYGTMDNTVNTLDFIIADTFDIPVDDVFQKVANKKWGYAITFVYNPGCKVYAVVDEGANLKIECEGESGYDKLDRLLYTGKAYGLYSANDFYFFTEVYNKYHKYNQKLLTLFAQEQNNGKWNGYYRSSLVLDGPRTFLSVVADPANGKPEYSAYWLSGQLTIEDEYTPWTFASSENALQAANGFTPMLIGTGAFTVASSVVSGYNSSNYRTLWGLGIFKDGKWTFKLHPTNSITSIAFSTLFGKMIPDAENGKYDYEFNLGSRSYTITEFPDSEDGTTTSNRTFYQTQRSATYPDSAEALKAVADGTYWEYFRKWEQERE